MGKIIFKNNGGEIHFGINAPEGFNEGTKKDLQNALDNLNGKKLWRCNVCNDLRIAFEPLVDCPTCFAKNAYVEIDVNEFEKVIGDSIMKNIIMFHGRECPHCAVMHPIVDKLIKEGFIFNKLEVWHDEENAEEMRKYSKIIMENCDNDLGVPTFLDIEGKRAICGEMSYGDLKGWISKE